MIKINTLRALKECGVVAVVRGNSKEVGVEISKACVKGGVKALEVTYTNKFANDIIKELCEIYEGQDDVVIGAGTVLDAETARAAMLAGAKYIVSPGFDLETAKICNRYKVPYLPGIMTINEIITAHEAGVDFDNRKMKMTDEQVYFFKNHGHYQADIAFFSHNGNWWS